MTEGVRYRVSMSRPHSHLFEVEALFPATDALELLLPVWTPGSYLVREFARHLQELSASDTGECAFRSSGWTSAPGAFDPAAARSGSATASTPTSSPSGRAT